MRSFPFKKYRLETVPRFIAIGARLGGYLITTRCDCYSRYLLQKQCFTNQFYQLSCNNTYVLNKFFSFLNIKILLQKC